MTPHENFDPRDEGELERTRGEIGDLLGGYRLRVLDRLEPSAEHRAAMHRMLLGLVTEDVLARKSRASFGSLVGARWQRFCDCWRELAAGSLAFRLASQFALALGVGLVLSIATIASIQQGLRAEERRQIEQERNLVPDLRVFEIGLPAAAEDGISAETPKDEEPLDEDPFPERR